MRCLIIDNYDSFTWNLADYVAQTFGSEPLVVRNDQHTWQEIKALGSFGCILVSPGPGSVTNPKDFNVSRDALEQDEFPVFGVCLGHQGLAYIYGGEITHAPVPFHGRTSTIYHDGTGVFLGLPPSFDAVRYHSLVVRPESLPANLVVTARTECGLIMGLRHVSRPKWGVQFHPESILTAHGLQLISNFRDEAYRYAGKEVPSRRPHSTAGNGVGAGAARRDPSARRTPERRRELQTFTRRLATSLEAETVFLGLYAGREHCFWLDSQSVREGISRFSFMGCVPEGSLLTYGAAEAASEGGAERYLAALERALESRIVVRPVDGLPFEFHGGYIGFMTYEMKEAFGAATTHKNTIPDALWMHVKRFLAFDHSTREVWLVAIAELEESASVLAWMDETADALKSLPRGTRSPQSLGLKSISVSMDCGRDDYFAAIERCKEKIVDGESYEVCLTNGFSFDLKLDPVELYVTMRRGNPAPFGAFIKTGKTCVLSTSPERFLKVDEDGTVQAKPIKGTCARSDDPATDSTNAARLAASEKDRAENLMIVDLMRNDLGRVSVPGSVHVSNLMDIESFKTVHQMVSTVESTLTPECSLVDLLRAVFPGGSITGAPKIRTMEIIDRLEKSPRGIYCGTIGYLGYNRIADLNIAIRTLSYDGTLVKFGAGGAITYLSQPEGEFQEILLKAESILRPIWQYINGAGAPFEPQLRDRVLCLEEKPRRVIRGHGSAIDAVEPSA
ncbi:aminodeoxychorismate synthase component I [Cystobacter ferrugineus]|uniref:aminodeoxychorismate synthase n=1 Tax=Cystobacter ferrugineus TaxID=83449 RepID=A0A1L9AXV3_9BACT|nr:aminodeoxychorismate synthase, component I [Cystobacter ferrugineus]